MNSSVAGVARKQRYLFLLRKIRQNQPLSTGEIAFVEDYDKRMAKKKKKIIDTEVTEAKTLTAKKKPKAATRGGLAAGRSKKKVVTAKGKRTQKKKVAKATKRRTPPLPVSVDKVKALGLTCESLTEAAGELKKPLEVILEKHPKLKVAWERGRFLRNLQGLAVTAVSVSEAGRALGMKGLDLRDLLDSDMEAADIWNQTRLGVLIDLKTALVEQAKEGKPAAAKQVEQFLRREIARSSSLDLDHVAIGEMVKLCNITRQGLHDWHVKYGLPRNSDKTYNLAEFIGWFETFTLKKRGPGTAAAVVMDPLKAGKAEKIQIDLKKARGQLLDREAVLAGLTARAQVLVSTLDRKAAELARLCANQPAVKIAKVLDTFFAEVKRGQLALPDTLRLSDAMAERFGEFLNDLKPDNHAA